MGSEGCLVSGEGIIVVNVGLLLANVDGWCVEWGMVMGFLASEFSWASQKYPLVNCYKHLWKDPPFSMGKSTINHHFPIAFCMFTRPGT